MKKRERRSILTAWRIYRKEGIRKPRDEKTKNLSKPWERKRPSGKAKEKRGFETAKDMKNHKKCRRPWNGPLRRERRKERRIEMRAFFFPAKYFSA
jgi:hypothetical protein